MCGIPGHEIDGCNKKDEESPYLNLEKCRYRHSKAWGKVVKAWRRILKFPRYPHTSLLKKLEEEAKKTKKSSGKNPTESLNMNFEHRDHCELCSIYNAHEFKIMNDEIVNTLTHRKVSPYLNDVEIYTPR